MTKHHFSSTIAKFRVERGANQSLECLMGDSPHERAKYSLIPEASVLVGNRAEGARIADEIKSRPVLSEGDVVAIDSHVYTAHRHANNRDWWRLVPVHLLRKGQRFYVDFEGMGVWKIRDAAERGAPVSHARLSLVSDPSADERERVAAADGRKTSAKPREHVRIDSLDDAERVVETLHTMMSKPPTHADYLRAIGHPVDA